MGCGIPNGFHDSSLLAHEFRCRGWALDAPFVSPLPCYGNPLQVQILTSTIDAPLYPSGTCTYFRRTFVHGNFSSPGVFGVESFSTSSIATPLFGTSSVSNLMLGSSGFNRNPGLREVG